MDIDSLDESYERLRATGPEFEGWLSNHGPMAAEALAEHGYAADIGHWLDGYVARLEEAPTATHRIDDWREALGDPRRLGDWLAWFDHELTEEPWEAVLHTWWPRLLPGIAAGATHGVIRVGHVVRVLREHGATPQRTAELAQGLGYWAARWQPVPKTARPTSQLATALDDVPPVPDQSGGINARVAQLDNTPVWANARRNAAPESDPEPFLRELVAAAVRRYASHAHGNPVMLVHAATAPNAVLRTLPSLPRELWQPSADAAWAAAAAITAAYSPTTPGPEAPDENDPADAFNRAFEHGDEHVIKLADTALDVHAWTGDADALGAITRATELIGRA